MKNDSFFKKFINNFETYLSAILFIAMTVLLFTQVVTRYCFHHAITWTEEISCVVFVWLVYLGVSAAVLPRKHLRVDVLLNSLPFKAKRIVLLFDNLVSIGVLGFLIKPIIILSKTFGMVNAKTDLLKMPKQVIYAVIPVCMAIAIIRFVQDSLRLMKEDHENLGQSVPSLDIAAFEAEARAKGYLKDSGKEAA